jgi:hypothetical protein
LRNNQEIVNELLGFLSKEHKSNLNIHAFTDISNVFLELVGEYREQFEKYMENRKEEQQIEIEPVSWVCNASMGHGKTTVLTSFLKWLVSEKRPKFKIPVLLAIRENNMADEIFRELKEFDDNCVLRLDKDTKMELEQYVPFYQIVIITHARLKQLTLGYGNMQQYRLWKQYPMNLFTQGEAILEGNIIAKRNRLLIIDEKPDFVNSSIFDIGSEDNAVDWFDKLSDCLKLDPMKSQAIKTQISNLIANELAENLGHVTTALVPNDELKTKRVKHLVSILKEIEENAKGYDFQFMEKLKAFKKMLFNDGVARIDEYKVRGKVGRKIMYAERVDYTKFKLNMLVLDGTSQLTNSSTKSLNLNKYPIIIIIPD